MREERDDETREERGARDEIGQMRDKRDERVMRER